MGRERKGGRGNEERGFQALEITLYKFRGEEIEAKDLEVSSLCLETRNQTWLVRKLVSNQEGHLAKLKSVSFLLRAVGALLGVKQEENSSPAVM